MTKHSKKNTPLTFLVIITCIGLGIIGSIYLYRFLKTKFKVNASKTLNNASTTLNTLSSQMEGGGVGQWTEQQRSTILDIINTKKKLFSSCQHSHSEMIPCIMKKLESNYDFYKALDVIHGIMSKKDFAIIASCTTKECMIESLETLHNIGPKCGECMVERILLDTNNNLETTLEYLDKSKDSKRFNMYYNMCDALGCNPMRYNP